MNKNDLLKLLGPLPKKCELGPTVLETADCGSYIRKTIEYAVGTNERVKSFLLVPKDSKERSPAVFCHHQHASQFDLGKSEVVGLKGDPDQAFGAELAERGYIVIAPDAIAFEERNWSSPTGDAEYYELTTRLVQGQTLLAKALHDVSVGLDYLENMSEVDVNRLGFVGHSYGGRMAIWAPAFDERIKASVSNCGCINYKDSIMRETGIQPEFCIPSIMQYGDVEDIVRLISPRALRIQATDDDKWSRGSEAIYEYALSSFPANQLELGLYKGKHVFTKEMRYAAYDFLDRHLRNRSNS